MKDVQITYARKPMDQKPEKTKNVPSKAAREYLAELGRKGGKAEVKTKGFGSLTPKQRAANAKKAAKTRWGKKKGTAVKKAQK